MQFLALAVLVVVVAVHTVTPNPVRTPAVHPHKSHPPNRPHPLSMVSFFSSALRTPWQSPVISNVSEQQEEQLGPQVMVLSAHQVKLGGAAVVVEQQQQQQQQQQQVVVVEEEEGMWFAPKSSEDYERLSNDAGHAYFHHHMDHFIGL